MNTTIQIVSIVVSKDSEGFRKVEEKVHHSVHAYREGRHGNERWANRATFTDATDLFRFRKIPSFTLENDMRIKCDEKVFEITSVEDVKGRGMYIEVLGRKVKPSG